jgi:hypothetical protein
MGNSTGIVAEHERRLAELDRLLPRSHPLPELEPDEKPLVVDGGIGVARRSMTDLEALEAIWTAADVHRLFPGVGGVDPVAAMAGLLAQWRERVHTSARPDDEDSAAQLTWPSRDTAMTRLFIGSGLMPSSIMAIHPTGYVAVGAAPDVPIRPLTEADLDVAVDCTSRKPGGTRSSAAWSNGRRLPSGSGRSMCTPCGSTNRGRGSPRRTGRRSG